jgi:hypothetical protein
MSSRYTFRRKWGPGDHAVHRRAEVAEQPNSHNGLRSEDPADQVRKIARLAQDQVVTPTLRCAP